MGKILVGIGAVVSAIVYTISPPLCEKWHICKTGSI